MVAKLSKKQRIALRQIDKLEKMRNKQRLLGIVSIGVMALVIFVYNALVYQLGVISDSNTIIRAVIYIIAMIIAGYCGIMFMRSSTNGRKIYVLRQQSGISQEMLTAWKQGEFGK